MAEWRLFDQGTTPSWTTPAWYADREHAPHLEHEPHRGRILTAAAMVNSLYSFGVWGVVDLGAGDGGLLSQIRPEMTTIGFDLQPQNARYGIRHRGVQLHIRDVVQSFPAADFAVFGWPNSCAVATEMLEHLVDPHRFVRVVAQHAKYLVASSPHEETDQNHYEYHTWAWDRKGYQDLLGQAGYDIIETRTIDIFQVVLARQEEHPDDRTGAAPELP